MHIAYCGFDCGQCPVYIATQTEDETMRDDLLIQYSTADNPLTRKDLYCSGCRTESAGLIRICSNCGMRLCAEKKNILICAQCREYPCKIVEKALPEGGQGRERLDRYCPQ